MHHRKIRLAFLLSFCFTVVLSQEKARLYYAGTIPQNADLKIALDSVTLNIIFFENQQQSRLKQTLAIHSNSVFQKKDSIFIETEVEQDRVIRADSFVIQALYRLDSSVVVKGTNDDVFVGGSKNSNKFIDLNVNSTPAGSLFYIVPLYKFNKKTDSYWLGIPDEIRHRPQQDITPVTVKVQRMVYAIIFDNHGKRGYMIYPTLPAVPETANNNINYHFP